MLVPFGGQRGITGLETAIVLIAFVVVSSVFAFAALSTGLFSADKAKETIGAGLAEARGSMELRGSVILEDTDTDGNVDLADFAALQRCFTGAAGDAAPESSAADVDGCGSIDLGDFEAFRNALTGP